MKNICDEASLNIIHAVQKELLFTELSYCLESDFIKPELEKNEQRIKEFFKNNPSQIEINEQGGESQ
jgi:hypothetical protein